MRSHRSAWMLALAGLVVLGLVLPFGIGGAAAAGRPAPPKVPATPPSATRAGQVATAHLLFGSKAAAPAPSGPPALEVAAPPASTPPPGPGPSSWLPSTPPLWPVVLDHALTPPATITSGVQWHTEHYQTVGGAQRAQVMNVDLQNPNVRLGMVEAGDKLVDPSDETISSMANRSGAVAGVNSDFFAIHASGAPLGMVVRNGVLEASPVPSWPDDVEVLKDGQVKMVTETFSGTATDGTSSQAVSGVNRPGQSGLDVMTSFLGTTSIPSSVVASGTEEAGSNLQLKMDSVTSGMTALPQLGAGQEDLVAPAGSAAAAWLSGSIHPGDVVTLKESLAPYNDVQTAVSGGAQLVKNGSMDVPVQAGGENNVVYPIVGVGVNQAGTSLIMAVFDGREGESSATGLTRPQFAQWMMQQGAYSAVEFDSGGSAEMVGRLPGDTQASVLNTPADGQERDVANGLFVYSNEASPGPAQSVAVDGNKPLTVLAGTTVPVAAYAVDASGNPASQPVDLSASPPDLATVSGHTLTASDQPGESPGGPGMGRAGRLVGTAGAASGAVALRVVSSLGSLSVSPSEPDLAPGATQAFSVSATTTRGDPVTLPASQVSWSVSPADLGSVSPEGVFTAASSGVGLATLTASAGGVKGTASVAVGQVTKVFDTMTDVGNWVAFGTEGSTGSLSSSSQAPPGASGSMDVSYDIPKGSGVKQVVFYPNTVNDQITADNGQDPTAVGLWVKGGSPLPSGSGSLSNGALTLAEGYVQVNGQSVVLYPTTVNFGGWTLVEGQLAAGIQYPLSVDFLDLLVINPASELKGDAYFSDLEGLYSPRPAAPFKYVPDPPNPEWLQFEDNPGAFSPNGSTLASFDDAHLVASDPNSTGSVVMKDIGAQMRGLPANERPDMVQTQGDMTDNGTLTDLDYLKSLLDGLGFPYHEGVGNHEIGQGVYPENRNFASVFGPTHYSYGVGPAKVIELDSSHIGINASDPFQIPTSETDQYRWLVGQLDENTSKVVFVVTHVPAYDPHPVANSQFSDRYEAQMYELLAQKYQQSHPQTHLVLLSGHARGYAEQVLDPQGQQVAGGIPNFTVADSGVPAYAPADQGGFYNYVLFHLLPDGTVQFAVQPVLASVKVTAPHPSLPVGGKETALASTDALQATGTTPTGDDLPPLAVPIQDPVSHYWTSSDPRAASVDPDTGVVTARSPGTATITVAVDGLTDSTTITVTG